MGTILAIDPGNEKSGYVIVEHDGEEIRHVLEVGKIENNVLLSLIAQKLYGNGYDVAIEMIAGMGMTVGQEVFDTCVWIGRFWQTVLWQTGYGPTRIFRREEKLDLCGSLSARPASRTSERGRKRIPVSFMGSRQTCGRLWPLQPHILISTSRG